MIGLMAKILAVAIASHGFLKTASAQNDVPNWPDPPTEADCRQFQTAINDYYDRADQEYKACYQGGSCGSAPARRGAAGVRRSTVSMCFYKASLRSPTQDVIQLLKADNQNKAATVVGQLSDKIYGYTEKIKETGTLINELRNYSNLSDSGRIELHTKLTQKLNGYVNKNELSSKLTDDALSYIQAKHQEALQKLDIEFKAIVSQHKRLTSKRDLIVDLSHRSVTQGLRTAGTFGQSADDRLTMKAELIERRYQNNQIALQRAAEERRLQNQQRAQAEREATQAQMRSQQEAQMFGALMQGFAAGFMGGSTGYASPPPNRSGTSVGPSFVGGGSGGSSSARSSGSSGLRCRPGESIQRCIHR